MRAFSFDRYTKAQAEMKDAISLVAKVWLDRETYVIVPNPKFEAIAYRVAKQDVQILDVLSPTPDSPADNEPVYTIAVRKDASCLRLDVGTVEQFWTPDAAEPATLAATLRVSIAFQANGEGTLTYNGLNRPCLGKTALQYPRDLTITAADKYRRRYSSEFGVWMDFAVLIWGQRGIFIHEGPATLAGNGGETAGCIHLGAPHAEQFFNWITGRTRITITYPW
jgi:hypothetical protein